MFIWFLFYHNRLSCIHSIVLLPLIFLFPFHKHSQIRCSDRIFHTAAQCFQNITDLFQTLLPLFFIFCEYFQFKKIAETCDLIQAGGYISQCKIFPCFAHCCHRIKSQTAQNIFQDLPCFHRQL